MWEKNLPDSSVFKQAFRGFLEEYGHRGVYELEIMNPRWREDPAYLLNFIKEMLDKADSSGIKAEQKKTGTKAWQEINNRVPAYRRMVIKWLSSQAVKDAEIRERAKSEMVRLMEPIRMLVQEIGCRLVEQNILDLQEDVYHCTWPELASILAGYWDGRGLKTLVSERKGKSKELEALSPPEVVIDDMPAYVAPVPEVSGDMLSGLGVAAGRASGKARLIHHPNEGGNLQHGDVLVAPSTDPAWTPLFLKASAIVMETGGHLSHGAIVAREYGVPAVVNIPGVMRIIKDSQEIVVDGDEGRVFL